MNYFQLSGQRVYVDSPESCRDQHGKDAPLFHVVQSPRHTTVVVRCPKSLTKEEREKLKEKP